MKVNILSEVQPTLSSRIKGNQHWLLSDYKDVMAETICITIMSNSNRFICMSIAGNMHSHFLCCKIWGFCSFDTSDKLNSSGGTEHILMCNIHSINPRKNQMQYLKVTTVHCSQGHSVIILILCSDRKFPQSVLLEPDQALVMWVIPFRDQRSWGWFDRPKSLCDVWKYFDSHTFYVLRALLLCTLNLKYDLK